jgi:hypothetical protein
MRPLAYPAFIDEDDRAPFFLGFFFISGQRTRRQRRISSSFRSRARPTLIGPRPSMLGEQVTVSRNS